MKLNILIVDDDEVYLKYFEKFIKDFSTNTNIIFARDGLEATLKLKNQNFDLIILDILLPKVDGLKILESINKKEIIVISSGEISEKNVKFLINNQIKNIIKKLFKIETLHEKFLPMLEKLQSI